MEKIINQSKEQILKERCNQNDHGESPAFFFENFDQFENFIIAKSQNSSQQKQYALLLDKIKVIQSCITEAFSTSQ